MNIFQLRCIGVAMAAMTSMAWSTSTCGAEKADTTRTMTRLSAKAANEKARRDLLSILQPTDKFTTGNRIRVSGIAMDTAPYGAGFSGLCRKDELFLVYRSKVKGPNGVDDPLRPVGFEAGRQFHVTKGPVTSLGGFSRQAAWSERDCQALGSDKSAPWFSAPSDLDAARGVNLFLAAMAALRSGDLKAKDCNLDLDKKTCEEQILELGQVSKITAVNRDCAGSAASAGPFSQCFDITTTDSVELTIVASFVSDDSVEPEGVQSISARHFIVLT